MSNSNKNESISFVVDKLIPANYRAIVYPILVLVVFVLWIIGKFTPEEAGTWLTNIATALGFGGTTLAAINRPQPILEEKEQ